MSFNQSNTNNQKPNNGFTLHMRDEKKTYVGHLTISDKLDPELIKQLQMPEAMLYVINGGREFPVVEGQEDTGLEFRPYDPNRKRTVSAPSISNVLDKFSQKAQATAEA